MLLVSAIMSCVGLAPSYADSIQEYTAKSVLALNLARYSDWPLAAVIDDHATVNLCLLGDDVVQQAFGMIDKKQVGNKALSVLNISKSQDLSSCHLLYISGNTDNTTQLIQESYKHHILTIGETDDFLTQGGIVYLEIADSKINLNVNVEASQKAGIQISARVLKLATIFKP